MLPQHSGPLLVESTADRTANTGAEGANTTLCTNHSIQGKCKRQDGQPGNAGPGRPHAACLEAGAKRRTTQRARLVLLTYSVYLHRDKKKEEKQEPTKLLREKTLSKTCRSESLTQKICQQLHNMIAWLENRSPWNKPERYNSYNSSWQEI